VKRRDEQPDSLELLLDTICNTFGGILFISILVVIMVNFSRGRATIAPPDASLQAELIEWERQLTQSNAEVDRLGKVVREQMSIENHIADPQLARSVRVLGQSQQKTTELVKAKTDRLSQIAQSQAAINQIASTLQKAKEERQEAEKELAELQQQIRREIASRSHTARLPKARPTCIE
jgi:hypothetical protein